MIKNMAHFSILTSLIGASVISLEINLVQLSIFRISIIAILFIALLNMLSRNYIISIIKIIRGSNSIKLMLIWLTYALISVCWVRDYAAWGKAVFFISLGVLCSIIYTKHFKKAVDILTSFYIISVMIITNNLIGWYEVLTGNYIFLANSQEYYARFKLPVSMFANTNDFATFMLISICILYVCFMNVKSKLLKILYSLTFISSIFLLVSTNSRANILGLVLVSLVFIYLSIRTNQNKRKFLITLTTLFLAILVILNHRIILMLGPYIFSVFDFTSEGESGMVRLNLLKNGFVFLINSFGFGTGAGNIEFYMINYGRYPTYGITNMHNWWIEILSSYGVFIFLVYMKFYICLFSDMLRIYRSSESKIESTISLGILCSQVGFVLGAISSSSNINMEWLWVYWGIAIAFQGNYINRISGHDFETNKMIIIKNSV